MTVTRAPALPPGVARAGRRAQARSARDTRGHLPGWAVWAANYQSAGAQLARAFCAMGVLSNAQTRATTRTASGHPDSQAGDMGNLSNRRRGGPGSNLVHDNTAEMPCFWAILGVLAFFLGKREMAVLLVKP